MTVQYLLGLVWMARGFWICIRMIFEIFGLLTVRVSPKAPFNIIKMFFRYYLFFF
jgi:hypothetical protein